MSSASGANSCVHCLVNGGNEIEVNSENVFEFVKRYTSFKMFDAIKEPLQQMRAGVFDVLPRNALDDLTTEDLRLLLNGVGEINVDTLVSYTTFNDETGGGTQQMQPQDSSSVSSKQINNNDRVARLKRWFWSTVRAMDIKQRQDLVGCILN
ncbi:unnamed protein product [Protopolystoma xenopodis]|uniref:HECT domain-containing protein n=1 Tax=Protopolystoma xenopodis TaxID=117903 RepID=A0A3S4ZVF3_9PLAT|nr:unnamed protein product [Protopolystoma xenopodis]